MSSNSLMTMDPVVLGLDMLLGHVALGAFHNSSERFEPPQALSKGARGHHSQDPGVDGAP